MSGRHQSQKLLQSRFDIVWRRLDCVLSQKPILVTAARVISVLLIFSAAVVWFACQNAGSPKPTMPQPTALELFPHGYTVKLPANIVPEDAYFVANTDLSDMPGEAMVYIGRDEVTAADATIQGRYLGFFRGRASLSSDGTKYVMSQGSGDDEQQLIVWIASGAIEYGYVSPEKLYPSTSPSLPSQYDAKLIALNFLEHQAHLMPTTRENLMNEATVTPGGYSVSPQCTAESTPVVAAAPSAPSALSGETVPATASSQPSPTYWQVDLPYYIAGHKATGPGSKIEVSVGDNGEIINMNWPGHRFGGYVGRMNVISPQQAFQMLTQGKGSLEISLDCGQVIVENVQLKYWLDLPWEKQRFIVPVYEFTGICLDKNGRTLEDFTGWSPALPDSN